MPRPPWHLSLSLFLSLSNLTNATSNVNLNLQALLVFHKSDSICEVVTLACQRHQLEVSLAKSKEEALDTLQKSYNTAQCYHLIIIDARSTKGLDAEHIARYVRIRDIAYTQRVRNELKLTTKLFT